MRRRRHARDWFQGAGRRRRCLREPPRQLLVAVDLFHINHDAAGVLGKPSREFLVRLLSTNPLAFRSSLVGLDAPRERRIVVSRGGREDLEAVGVGVLSARRRRFVVAALGAHVDDISPLDEIVDLLGALEPVSRVTPTHLGTRRLRVGLPGGQAVTFELEETQPLSMIFPPLCTKLGLDELRKAEERQSLKDGRRANGWLPVIRLCAMTCEGYEASPSRSLDRRGPGLGAP